MAAQQEYKATFAIGAKLQSSFGSVFSAAGARMKQLGAAAMKFGGFMLKVAGAIGLAAGALAAFGVGAVFAKIFGGAEKAAKDAYNRTQQLTAILGSHPELQKLGTAAIQGQVKAIQKLSAELGKVGVIHSDHYEGAARYLALLGTSPAKIGQMLPVLGDVLVATKGITATQADMESLASGITKAIGTGQTKALADVGIYMDKNQKKTFQAMNQERRRVYLLDELSKKYAGVNQEAAKTDLGKIQQFENLMAGFSQTIGEKMIPMQARWAEFWMKTLPEIMPIVENVFGGITKAMGDVATWATNNLVPALKHVADFFEGQEFQVGIKEFGETFNELGATLGPLWDELSKLFGLSGKTFPQFITDEILQTIKDTTRVIQGLDRLIKALGEGWNQLAAAAVGAWAGIQSAWSGAGAWFESQWAGAGDLWNTIAARAADIWPEIKADAAGLAEWFGTEWAKIASGAQSILAAITQPFLDAYAKIQADWATVQTMFLGIPGQISSGLAGVTEAIKKPFVDAIEYIKKIWDDLIRAITSFDIGAVARDIGAKAAAAVNPANWFGGGKKPAGHQRGGIITSPELSWLGEKGPEAVIPLRGEQSRAEGLLGAAAGALGLGASGRGGAGPTTLNFNPSIVIQGNADESAQRSLDAKLRALARDFMTDFRSAQSQERRLAFGG